MKKELDFLWSGEEFKTRRHYNPWDSHLIRMTYGEAKLLNKYCKKAKQGILEIGRFFGGSTYLLVASSPENIPVLSVDLKNYIQIYKKPSDVPHRIDALKGAYSSDNYVKVVNYIDKAQQDKKLTLLDIDSKKLKLKEDYDVIFIDGDHSYTGVKNDVEKVLKPSTKYIILHDYFEESGRPAEASSNDWSKWVKAYDGVKNCVDELISQNICKILGKADTMIALEYIKK